MIERLDVEKARHTLPEVLDRVQRGGDMVVLTSSGEPAAAMIPVGMYDRMMADREDRFRIIDEIHSKMPVVTEEEAEADIAAAIAAVRSAAP